MQQTYGENKLTEKKEKTNYNQTHFAVDKV